MYVKLLKNVEGICVYSGDRRATNNYAYFTILVTEESKSDRDAIYDRLKDNNIFSRKYFYPVTSDQACFKNKYKSIDIPVARSLSQRVLTLPFYEGMGSSDIERIVNIIKC